MSIEEIEDFSNKNTEKNDNHNKNNDSIHIDSPDFKPIQA